MAFSGLVAMLFFIPLAALPCQELAERTVCVFDFMPMEGSDASYAAMCADTLALELEGLGYTLVPNATSRAYALPDRSAASILKAAIELGADVAVVGFYVLAGEDILFGCEAYDVLASRPALGITMMGKAGIEVFSTVDAVSAEVAKRVREALAPLPAAEITVARERLRISTVVVERVIESGKAVTLTLAAWDEGALVYSGDELLGTIAEGKIVLQGKAGTELGLAIRKEGYYDADIVLRVPEQDASIGLPKLARASRLSLAVSDNYERPFGAFASIAWFPMLDTLAFGIGLGARYIPYSTAGSTKPEIASLTGGIIELPAELSVELRPLALFWPTFPIRPYYRIWLSGDAYFFPWSGLRSSMPIGLEYGWGMGLGLHIAIDRWQPFAEIGFAGPPLGTAWGLSSPVYTQNGTMRLRLGIGMAL